MAGPGTFATADADTASKPIALSFVSSVSAIRIGFAAGEFPAREFPIQREIQKLEEELHAFNQRIAELEDEGHNGRAINVLKANALDFASRIDELRCILVEQTKKRKSS